MRHASRYLLICLLAMSFPAQASLVGNDVDVLLDGDTLGTLIDETVTVLDPGGPEASATSVAVSPDGDAAFHVDIGPEGFVFEVFCDTVIEGCDFPSLTLTLSNLSWAPEVGQVVGIASIIHSTNTVDPDPGVASSSTTPTGVMIQWEAFSAYSTGDNPQRHTFTVSLDVEHFARATPVPASLWLMLPLLGLLGFARRRIS